VSPSSTTNGKEKVSKFDARSNESIFIGYSFISIAYRVYNKYINVIEEYIHVVFYETNNGLSR